MILLVPSAPVQNLRALNASQFSVLIYWENITFVHQNGEILFYVITTNFTDANSTTPDLSSDFVRVNCTKQLSTNNEAINCPSEAENSTEQLSNNRVINYFLLKNLWYDVDFTVVVTPHTRLGAGPNEYVTFMLDRG